MLRLPCIRSLINTNARVCCLCPLKVQQLDRGRVGLPLPPGFGYDESPELACHDAKLLFSGMDSVWSFKLLTTRPVKHKPS